MKTLLTLVVALTVGVVAASAAPVACLGVDALNGETGTMAELEANMNSVDGCYIGDKIYSGFGSTGFVDLSLYQVEIQNLQNPPLPDFHGFVFLSDPGDSIGVGAYQIAYSILVNPAFPLQFIDAHSAGINVNAGDDAVDYVITGAGASTVTPISLSSGSLSGAITPITQGPLTFSLDLTVGGDRVVTSFAHQVFQVTASDVPEPSTYLMLGAGLVALALFRRRSSRGRC